MSLSSSAVASNATPTQPLNGRQPREAGARLRAQDEFRVGSYVVHTPPSQHIANSGRLVGPISHIPGYQYKSRTFESPPLSPNKTPKACISIACANNSDGQPVGCQQQANSRQPRAIPRSSWRQTRGQKEETDFGELEHNNMGDRLSTPTKVPLKESSTQLIGLSESGDCLQLDSKSQSSERVTKGRTFVSVRQRENGVDRVLTPRLPRGVSRIPHQVNANEIGSNLHNQQQESTETCISNSSRYLTFSKDQATSHFKSLKRELAEATTSQVAEPKLVEREKKSVDKSDNETRDTTFLSSSSAGAVNSNNRQPICEAFIMTGQSMLKLSCDESENKKPKANSNKQTHLSSEEIGQQPIGNKVQKFNRSIQTEEDSSFVTNRNFESQSTSRTKEEETAASMGLRLRSVSDGFESAAMASECVEGNSGQVGPSVHQAAPPDSTSQTKTTPETDAPFESIETNPRRNKESDSPDSSQLNHLIHSDNSPKSHPKQDIAISRLFERGDSPITQPDGCREAKMESDSKGKEEIEDEQTSSPSTPTCTDLESSRRLAKRLYNLSGFKEFDVCHHLTKNNPFSRLVAQEYLNLFDFRSMKLDSALRKFLSKLQLNGETQERERLLSQFSQRYYDCNKDKFPNADVVQTLVCALILLNTDLHGGHNKKKRSKLSLDAFSDGLNSSIAAINESEATPSTYTFPRHLLVDLYESIKKRPLKCSNDKCDMKSFEAELDKIYSQRFGKNRSNTLPTRRFAPGSNAPGSTLSASSRRHLKQGLNKLNGFEGQETAIEFKSGYLNRKRIFEAGGCATSKGRRSWRRVYIILQDLRLVMRFGTSQEDDNKQKLNDTKLAAKLRNQIVALDMKNTVKIHHTFAKRSTSYTKRDYVFHLRLADQSEFLIQANSEQEMNLWIDTINFASACLSSPALPNAVSNTKQQPKRTHRPILPVSYTKLSYWEQLIDHEERLQRLKLELDDHLSEAPNTKNANKRFKTEFIEKIAYLKQEIERYTVYVDLMRKKSNSPEAIILSKHPQIASLTPSDEMILSLPSFAPLDLVAAVAQEEKSRQSS